MTLQAKSTPSGPGRVAWAAALIVSGSAAALSFAALADLARISGVANELAPLLPITIDAGVLVAAKFWLTPGLSLRVTRFARMLMLSLIAVSSLGNIAGHAFAAVPPQRLWLTALVSLVAPLTLAGLAHLIVIARLPVAPSAPLPHPEPKTEPVRVTPPLQPLLRQAPKPDVAPTAQPGGRDNRMSGDPRVDQLKAWIDELGEVPSQRRVIDKFSVHNNTAKKLIEAATVNGHKVI